MADAGFFKGTSAEQDSRFANKQKKLLKQMKFPDNIDVKVDMLKVNLDVLKPWITKRLQELLGIEDDVVIEFVFNQLEDKNPDPKMMQINLTGFLGGSKARLFIGELWKILSDAQASPDGIPAELVEMKKKELLKRQEEDERLREIRKREEESHRQDIKPDMDKLDNKSNGRNQSRYENGNSVGYKSRAYYDDNRRDRRRSPPKTRRTRDSPEPKPRRVDKKPPRSVSKSSESENDQSHRQEKTKPKSKSSSNRHDRHRLPSKSPSHSRSPIKSTRKTEKQEQRSSSSSSTDNNTSQPATTKSKNLSSLSSNVDRSHKKTKDSSDNQIKKQSVPKPKSSPVKETVVSKSKKNKKQSKRTRSASASRSSSSFSRSTSSAAEVESKKAAEAESKKNKKHKKKPQPTKNRSSSRSRSPSINRNKKKDDHKSRKQSKSSSRKHHQSNDSKRKSHRDHPDKSKTKKSDRKESSKKKISNSSENEILPTPSSPKKPRLESQIRVQTPPPPPLSDDNEVPHQEVPNKSNRTERIVVLEESRTDTIGSRSTRVSITTQRISNDEHPATNNSSEDENEIDLRERLLREKAIKSMRHRQLSTNNNDIHTKTTTDRIVYKTQ